MSLNASTIKRVAPSIVKRIEKSKHHGVEFWEYRGKYKIVELDGEGESVDPFGNTSTMIFSSSLGFNYKDKPTPSVEHVEKFLLSYYVDTLN